jgi:hypothetical protein
MGGSKWNVRLYGALVGAMAASAGAFAQSASQLSPQSEQAANSAIVADIDADVGVAQPVFDYRTFVQRFAGLPASWNSILALGGGNPDGSVSVVSFVQGGSSLGAAGRFTTFYAVALEDREVYPRATPAQGASFDAALVAGTFVGVNGRVAHVVAYVLTFQLNATESASVFVPVEQFATLDLALSELSSNSGPQLLMSGASAGQDESSAMVTTSLATISGAVTEESEVSATNPQPVDNCQLQAECKRDAEQRYHDSLIGDTAINSGALLACLMAAGCGPAAKICFLACVAGLGIKHVANVWSAWRQYHRDLRACERAHPCQAQQ